MWFITLILLIFILGIIILVHEFGHFITAKKSGVHIYEFSIGMGPIIKTHKGKDGIDYNIRAFPIGGFVSMAGEVYEDDETNKIPKDKFMCNKSWWKRVIILGAGVFNNFVLAIVVLFVLAIIWGAPSMSTKIAEDLVHYPAYQAGIKKGDEIISINGHKTPTWDIAQTYLVMKDKDNIYDIEVKHPNGSTEVKRISPTKKEDHFYSVVLKSDKEIQGLTLLITKEENNTFDAIIIDELNQTEETVHVERLEQDTYDTIKVTKSDGSIETIKANKTDDKKEFDLEITSSNKKLSCSIDYEYNKFGLKSDKTVSHGFLTSIKFAFQKFGSLLSTMWITVISLFTGKIAVSSLSGPVGIYHVVGLSLSAGLSEIIYLIAFLSINVGLINILPIPAFDGGRILFLIIEKIKGSKINAKFENTCHTIFFFLIILLMIYITVIDLLRFA